jgi:4-diphosphocytidyl-2-C-methyl-D-erythritol kinase
VNLCLHVNGVRAGGLHEICSIFQPVTLADEVALEAADGIEDEVFSPGVPGPNIAAAALAAFRERFGWDGPPVRLTVEKRIPLAAGLGGGSADAGAVLRLVLAASGLEPPSAELIELALGLGADVPSQLEPARQLVGGAGEQLEPLGATGRLALVLLAGAGELRTGDVYARADELGLPAKDLGEVAGRLRRAFAGGAPSASEIAGVLHNDLEAAACDLEPAAAEALALLREAGALGAAVSGSGPAAFGVFADGAHAERARAALAERWRGTAVIAAGIDRDYAAVRSAED